MSILYIIPIINSLSFSCSSQARIHDFGQTHQSIWISLKYIITTNKQKSGPTLGNKPIWLLFFCENAHVFPQSCFFCLKLLTWLRSSSYPADLNLRQKLKVLFERMLAVCFIVARFLQPMIFGKKKQQITLQVNSLWNTFYLPGLGRWQRCR